MFFQTLSLVEIQCFHGLACVTNEKVANYIWKRGAMKMVRVPKDDNQSGRF